MASFSELVNALSRVHEQQVTALQKEIDDLRCKTRQCDIDAACMTLGDSPLTLHRSEGNNAHTDDDEDAQSLTGPNSKMDTTKGSNSDVESSEEENASLNSREQRHRVTFGATSEALGATSPTLEMSRTTSLNDAVVTSVMKQCSSMKYGIIYGQNNNRKGEIFPDLRYDEKTETVTSSTTREDFDLSEKTMQSLLESNRFEVMILILVTANSILMCLETQYNGFNTGYRIGYPDYQRSTWPGASDFFAKSEEAFLIVFTIEIVVRVLVFRCKFIWVSWNWLDLSIVMIGWIDRVAPHNLEPKIARLLRLTKVARILRALRTGRFMTLSLQ